MRVRGWGVGGRATVGGGGVAAAASVALLGLAGDESAVALAGESVAVGSVGIEFTAPPSAAIAGVAGAAGGIVCVAIGGVTAGEGATASAAIGGVTDTTGPTADADSPALSPAPVPRLMPRTSSTRLTWRSW